MVDAIRVACADVLNDHAAAGEWERREAVDIERAARELGRGVDTRGQRAGDGRRRRCRRRVGDARRRRCRRISAGSRRRRRVDADWTRRRGCCRYRRDRCRRCSGRCAGGCGGCGRRVADRRTTLQRVVHGLDQAVHSDNAVVLAIERLTAAQLCCAERDVDAKDQIVDADDVHPGTVADALRAHRCGREPHESALPTTTARAPPRPLVRRAAIVSSFFFVAQVTMKVRGAALSPSPSHPNFVY